MLKDVKYKLFKIHLIQEISEGNYAREDLSFVNVLMYNCENKQGFMLIILSNQHSGYF